MGNGGGGIREVHTKPREGRPVCFSSQRRCGAIMPLNGGTLYKRYLRLSLQVVQMKGISAQMEGLMDEPLT